MANRDSTGNAPTLPETLSGAFADFGVLRRHELETLSRCAFGLGAIVGLLDGDGLAGELNDHDEEASRLSPVQRAGLLSAAAVLVDAVGGVTEAHERARPAEFDARRAYSLALATGTLEGQERGADGTHNP